MKLSQGETFCWRGYSKGNTNRRMYEELYTIKRCGFGAFMCGFLFARFVKQSDPEKYALECYFYSLFTNRDIFVIIFITLLRGQL